MAKTKQDEELTLLLTKLYGIQEQVGAKEKTSDEKKKNLAEQASQVTMGKGKRAKGQEDRITLPRTQVLHPRSTQEYQYLNRGTIFFQAEQSEGSDCGSSGN